MDDNFDDLYAGVFDDHAIETACAGLHGLNAGGATMLCFVSWANENVYIGFAQGFDEAFIHKALGNAAWAHTPSEDDLFLSKDALWKDILFLEPQAEQVLPDPRRPHPGTILRSRLAPGLTDLGGDQTYSALLCAFLSPAAPKRTRVAVIEHLTQFSQSLSRVLTLRTQRIRELARIRAELVETFDVPVILANDHYDIAIMNRAAKSYWRTSGHHARDIWPTSLSDLGLNMSQLQDQLNKRTNSVGDATEITQSFVDGAEQFTVAKIRRNLALEGVVSRTQRAALGLPYPELTITLKVAGQPKNDVLPEVVRAFNITPAEQRMLQGLLLGKTLAEVARDGGPAYNTLRNHLASVLTKTGHHSQVELVRFLSSL